MKNTVFVLMSLLLAACAPQHSEQPADLVVLGGTLITLEEAQPVVHALATRNQRILALGSEEGVRPLIGPKTRVLDLKGAVAYPGFYDAHAHFLGVGKAKMQLDLGHSHSWKEIVDLVATAVKTSEPGSWIEGRGWHQEKWDSPPTPAFEGLPIHQQLSLVSPRNPVILTHASGHMVMVNSMALQMAGIDANTPNPPGGEILRDETSHATGVLRENAIALVRRLMPQEDSPEIFKAKVKLASEECLSKGLTSFEDAGSSIEEARAFRRMAEAGELNIRLNLMLSDSNEKLSPVLDDLRLTDSNHHFLSIRAIKRWLDGALGSHGAWLLAPYTDLPSSSGMNTETMSAMRETAALAAEHGYQLCVHAIGDRANRETLDLYEEAFHTHPEMKDLRWRIEHAQHLAPEDVLRFSQLGIIASMQPTHCTSDGPWVAQRLGEERAQQESYLWRTLLDSGAHIASGTDAPVEDVDPLATFYSAVTRKMANGETFQPEQCMTRQEALRSMTVEAAYAAFQENQRGTLKVGKLADLTVLSGNLLEVPAEEIPKLQVMATIVGGRIRYQR